MNNTIVTTIIQKNLHWQDKKANLQSFEDKIMSIKEKTDLIILPEMFTTAFTMDAKNNAERYDVIESVKRMISWAQKKEAAICGSIIVEEKGNYYNRLYFVKPNGEYHTYDKRHLFRMAKEDENYTAGNKKVVIEYKGWKICPFICYDLRFPVWSRNVNNEYDLLIYVANWPAPRVSAWSTLLRARAAENLAYCIGVNRTGEDGNGFNYSGYSAFVNFKGEVIQEFPETEQIHTETFSKDEMEEFRNKFPAHMDADSFKIF